MTQVRTTKGVSVKRLAQTTTALLISQKNNKTYANVTGFELVYM